MSGDPQQSLRVLIANERQERLGTLTDILAGLGHVVVAAGVDVEQIGAATRQEHPDVALVALGDSSEHALEHISNIVREAACPVIALLHTRDATFVNEASKRGIFAHVTDGDPGELQSTLDIALRRFAEYHNLEGAFARRAMIERAKGILMATHDVDDQQAFEMLRSHSQHTGTKLLDLAEAVVHSHRLLAPRPGR
ncbi:MAG TPA: ANTAR domain-containing protein [Gaiellaceae bacterium]|jgi:response regulator NasT|nr:ANTAR domain-containing protein [Gaiellaceae bacterium]